MNYSRNLSKTAMAKRIIISWIVVALIFGAIGFTFGYAKTHITVNKKDEAINTMIHYTVADSTLYGGVTKALQVKLPHTWESKKYDFKPLDVNMSIDLQEYVFYLSESYQIDFSFVMAVIQHESQFDPNIISSTHDYGLMQINQCNHEYIRQTLGITNFLDPYQNVHSGVFILRQLFKKYDDPAKVLMAYNMGESAAKKLWDKGVYSSDYSESILTIQKQYSEQLEGEQMKKQCVICGCIMEESTESTICEVCQDDLDEVNPYRQWEKDYEGR